MSVPGSTSWRRTWMALVAALAVTFFATRAPAQPVAGGDFTFGYSSSFVDILDPHVTSQSISHFIMLNIFDPLVPSTTTPAWRRSVSRASISASTARP